MLPPAEAPPAVIGLENLIQFMASELVDVVTKAYPEIETDPAAITAKVEHLLAGHDVNRRLVEAAKFRLGLV